ncbi:MAG: elongation factor P [Bacteroidales bacterium]|jgi:elongation factor P|nr:elongation factor P [Bacteroidales bacterium]MDD3700561.1 elongation factor P [Bacteroidales bacterium]MDY0368315.1 elongation factor P [Bacteroidales bacterium]
MATTADFRNGLIIEFNNELYSIVEFQHVKPGKGAAFVRTRLRNLKTGKILPNTFTAGVKINVQRVERRPMQYLYNDGTDYHFMNSETFEQIHIPKDLINAPQFLKEGDIAEVMYHTESDSVLSCELPVTVVLEVSYTEPGERGNTATNAMKDATLETGAAIRVPLFINIGDKVKVNTAEGTYSERVKE